MNRSDIITQTLKRCLEVTLDTSCLVLATVGFVFFLVAIALPPSSFERLAYAIQPSAPAITLPCRILSVHDGDTCTIELTTRASIRLLDCWAPELSDGEAGEKAKQRLTQLVEGKIGLVTIPVHDSLGKSFTFGRLLARLRVDDRDVSEVLVSEGHATKEQVR